MKAKNILSIRVKFGSQKLSIYSAAKKLVSILVALGELDSLFLNPILIVGQKSEVILDLSDGNLDKQILELANGILRAERNEITQFENNKNPTIEYVRNQGYPILLKFKVRSEIVFWIGCRIGSNINQTLSLRDFGSTILFEYSWYEKIFKSLVCLTNAKVGTVMMSNESFGKFYNQVDIKYPIGWITYFSNSYEVYIPDDLKEVRYEFVEDGKYLYTSDEDFMKDKEAYFGNREKLKRVIAEIKERVPGFSKDDNQPIS